MRWKTIAIACLGLAALSASAQVHRCKDAAGKTIYSDQPCAAGQAGAQIERQRSQEEIMQERMQAAEANSRKYERQATEQGQMQPQAPRQMGGAQSTQQPEGWQQRKNRENAATSARSITNNGNRWDSTAEAQRGKERREEAQRQEAAQPAPTMLTNCNKGFCYDNQGGVYHKNGQNAMTAPNGKTSHRAGPAWNC